MKLRTLCALASMASVLAACAADKTTSTEGSSSGASGTAASGGTPAEPAPTTETPAEPTPTPKVIAAPQIEQIMKMAGGLHVVWELPAKTTCDKIEGERKSATEPYKVVWTLPGDVDNKHDGAVSGTTMYTYRVRCKVGSDYSPYSNEMAKSPQ